jgi:2-polyprenyl-6-methoxyphenol hydroxylase-like FAD-dependent oxidoreductase
MRVLISGAGIAGPSLAFWLAKTNAHVTVVEKAATLLPHGQNVYIQGSGVTAAKKMGLLDEIKRNNTTEKGTQFIDSKGRTFAPFPVKPNKGQSLTSEFEILRADLAKILYTATENQSRVSWMFGTTIKEVISNDNDSVKVELSSGEVKEYDLLVAADGQWSKVRKMAFAPESIEVVDKGMYVAYFTLPRLPQDNDWWNVYFGLQRRIITLRPDPYGTIRAMFTFMPRSDDQKKEWETAIRAEPKLQRELLRRTFHDAGWQAQRLLDAMDQAPDFYFHPMQQIKLTGQGTTLAIAGAYILAGELNKLVSEEHPGKALEAYEKVFHPFIESVQQIPSIIPGIAHSETARKRWLLQSFASTVSKVLPWLQFLPIFNGIDPELNNDGFALPPYPDLDRLNT